MRNVSDSTIISTKNYDLKNGSGSCGICYAVCPVTAIINLTYNHRQQQQKKQDHRHHHHHVLLSQSFPVISTKIFLSFLARWLTIFLRPLLLTEQVIDSVYRHSFQMSYAIYFNSLFITSLIIYVIPSSSGISSWHLRSVILYPATLLRKEILSPLFFCLFLSLTSNITTDKRYSYMFMDITSQNYTKIFFCLRSCLGHFKPKQLWKPL